MKYSPFIVYTTPAERLAAQRAAKRNGEKLSGMVKRLLCEEIERIEMQRRAQAQKTEQAK